MPAFVRRFLPALATTALAALAVSGCVADTTTDGDADEGVTELVWAIEGANLSAGHMDPQTSQLDVSAMVQRAVLDSLVFQADDGTFSPWLATSWEIEDEGASYVFTLREDVTFHDGAVFDAAAVKANFDRIADPDTASAQAASMLGGEWYAGTEIVDDFVVRVNFTQPYAPFLQAASTALLGFWSPAVLEDSADQLAAGGPDVNVGTGPFEMTEYIADSEILFAKNVDYAWAPEGQGAPNVDVLRVSILPEASVRVGVVETGEAHLASNIPPSLSVETGQDITYSSHPYPGLPYSLYLNEKYGLFADVAVREAFARGIDISSAVTEIYEGQYTRAWSILSETTPYYDPSLAQTWPYDPAIANDLLDAAGWTEGDDGIRVKDGERLSVRWIAWTPVPDDRTALANAIQSDLAKVGIEVVRDVLEPGAYNEQYGPKTFDLTDWGFSGGDPDLLRSHLHTDGFQNASQVSDKAIDSLLEQGVASADENVRADVYRELQQWNAEQYAIVPLYSPALITAVSEGVSGLTYDLFGRPLFFDVSLE